ncbi:hypothetical protein VTO73DRAFT_3980 [Trametes versicolor]
MHVTDLSYLVLHLEPPSHHLSSTPIILKSNPSRPKLSSGGAVQLPSPSPSRLSSSAQHEGLGAGVGLHMQPSWMLDGHLCALSSALDASPHPLVWQPKASWAVVYTPGAAGFVAEAESNLGQTAGSRSRSVV